jgi:hypothetical protein
MEHETTREFIITALVVMLARQIKAQKTTTSDCLEEAVKIIKEKRPRVLQLLQDS